MSRFPYMPFFVDAYLAKTSHLQDAMHGRYLKLLMLLWQAPGCRIPNDDKWIAHKLGKTKEQVHEEIRPLINEFFRTTGNWIWNKRLMDEWERLCAMHNNRSEAANVRWRKEKHLSNAYAPLTPKQERKKERETKTEQVEEPQAQPSKQERKPLNVSPGLQRVMEEKKWVEPAWERERREKRTRDSLIANAGVG